MPMKMEICKSCKKMFLQHSQEEHGYCRICNIAWRKEQKHLREEAEQQQWQEQEKEERKIFEKEILQYNPIPIESIQPSDRTLYIIGNGFDLMHRVQSSYYSFRDSLGKKNNLRWTLEISLTPNDIWADFENSLGNLNLNLMASRNIVDMWLDNCGFYDKDSGAAEFYMAVEAAANPISNIAYNLQPAFRRWVDKLDIGTDDRPLTNFICPEGKCLTFHYTEFIETLYGVKKVCYIHGCRKNKKEKFILGHKPETESIFNETNRNPRSYRQAAVDVAQENVFDLIGRYNEDITKNSQVIIKNHKSFFTSLLDIDQVVVIGHSLSSIDWDYFIEINNMLPSVKWYFGIFGLNDLKNLEKLVNELGLTRYNIFRTDVILTKPNKKEGFSPQAMHCPKPKFFTEGDNVVSVSYDFDLKIEDEYECIMPDRVKNVVILDRHIFIVLNDINKNILFFSKKTDCWSFIAQLESFEHQSLINQRLCHVFYNRENITFVYNNRVRTYGLETGEMIENRQVRCAKNIKYAGREVINKFIKQ